MNNLCKSCEHGGVYTDKHESNSLPVKEEAVDVVCSSLIISVLFCIYEMNFRIVTERLRCALEKKKHDSL